MCCVLYPIEQVGGDNCAVVHWTGIIVVLLALALLLFAYRIEQVGWIG